jgi:serine/threonine-protein kinase
MERIGRYQITRELGRGSMSIVYEGFDNRIDRHLAIKVLREDLARDVRSRQRFLREARAAGRLGHPNIVTVFDVGQGDAMPYLVMELIPGTTLADHLHRQNDKVLSVSAVLDIAIQLCEALQYAHTQGVIHRDIKPANIHYDAESGRVKLMDFGIAALEGNHRSSGDAQHILGTPHYMAPEQINGTEASRSSDMYALGVVLFQLLSGELPYAGNTVAEVVDAINNRRMKPLRAVDPKTPRALIDLVRRLTNHNPASRPDSAAKVRDELEDIQNGMRRGLLQSVRRNSFVWRRTALIGVAVSAILLLGLAYVYQSQTEAITGSTYGYGDALASIIAQESAEPLILEDSTALSLMVSDFSVNAEVEFVHVTDADGLVVASTNPYMRGRQQSLAAGQEVLRSAEAIRLISNDAGQLVFQVPVRFQSQRVGEVYLGIDGSALTEAANATLVMLAAVFGLTLLTAMIGLSWMTRRQQRSVAELAWGLKRLASGQRDIRIDSGPRDEFVEAHKQFNRLAIMLDESARAAPGQMSAGQFNSAQYDNDTDVAAAQTVDLSAADDDTRQTGAAEETDDNDKAASGSKVSPLRR